MAAVNVRAEERTLQGGSATARRIAAIALFVALTAAASALAVPVPGSPVPVTFQTLMVLLSGVLLGPMLGASAQVTYVALGALGAPIFAGGLAGLGHLVGPTGGYLLAFPVAAAVAGWLAPRGGHSASRRGVLRLAVALTAATLMIYAGGIAQLSIFVGAENALLQGALPFLVGDGIKIVVGVLLAYRLRDRTLGLL